MLSVGMLCVVFAQTIYSGFDLALPSNAFVPWVLTLSLWMASSPLGAIDLEAPCDDQCLFYFVLYTHPKNDQIPQNHSPCAVSEVWGGMQAGKLRGKAPAFIPYSVRIKEFFDKWNGCQLDKDWSLPLTG